MSAAKVHPVHELAPCEPVVDKTASCTFYMLKADFVRDYPEKQLPFWAEIREKHPEAMVEVTITWAEVVSGKHVQNVLSISHRWMLPTSPDPDCEQLKAVQSFLQSEKGKDFKLVWLDSACMPQDQPHGSRSAEDTASFKRMLKDINMLFLGTSVLILLDLSYLSRCESRDRRGFELRAKIECLLRSLVFVPAQSGHNSRRG